MAARASSKESAEGRPTYLNHRPGRAAGFCGREVFLNNDIGYVAQALEDEGDLVLFDEPADLFDSLGRVVTVVEANQIDLAAINPAMLVEHLEVGKLGLADGAVGGSRTTVGHGLANLDLGICDTGTVFFLSRGCACGADDRDSQCS